MNATESISLAEALPLQIKRCQEIIPLYTSLPNGVGTFGAIMIQRDIDAAIKASAEGDTVGMIRAFQALSEVGE